LIIGLLTDVAFHRQ